MKNSKTCKFSIFQMAGQDPKWQKDAADQNFDYMFKLLIIGNSSVGKTSFLFRYADDSFTSAFVSTVGIDFKVKTVFRHDKRVKLQIWVSNSDWIRSCRNRESVNVKVFRKRILFDLTKYPMFGISISLGSR